jgi:predicted ATP-dependent endonuclease of OLD family
MKIKKIEIENFRSFKSDVINLNPYTCLVGPNGAGKSTVLSALNVFFQERATSVTDISKLNDEDYFAGDTNKSIKITLTFNALCHASRKELSAYVRQDELVVSAEAVFDRVSGYGAVRHFGQRLGLEDFRVFYDKEKAGAKGTELTEIYDSIKSKFTELPAARSKDDKIQALRNYEAAHNDQCVLIPSADDFYGVNSTGKLAQFIQWVYVPAVKDAGEEGLEAKNTAL